MEKIFDEGESHRQVGASGCQVALTIFSGFQDDTDLSFDSLNTGSQQLSNSATQQRQLTMLFALIT